MRGLIIVIVILTVGLLLFGLRRDRAPVAARPAPDFTLTDLGGTPATLSAYQGKVVLLDFWATWCPPCRASLPHTQALSTSRDVADGNLVVLTVNAGEPPTTVNAFLKTNSYTFRVLLDAKGDASAKYKVRGIPTFVVINRDGSIAWQRSGFDKSGLDAALAAALRKE